MDLLQHVPTFTTAEAAGLAEMRYGIQGLAEPLESERDQNFLITANSGERFVLKIANALEEASFLEAQAAVMTHVGRHLPLCPRIIPTASDESFGQIVSTVGSAHLIRMVTYLPGTPISRLPNLTLSLWHNLGRQLGRLDCVLADFDYPAIHRDFHWDMMNGPRIVEEYSPLIADENIRRYVCDLRNRFEREVLPLSSGLRTSVIHNDANSDNVLVKDDQVVGLIDFGDMVYSSTVGELAVAIAYAVLDMNVPLRVAATILKGYHSENPLENNEIEVLWGFVLMRLCMSASIAAHQRSQRPDNEYLNVSQGSIARTLPKLAHLDVEKVKATFREACHAEGSAA